MKKQVKGAIAACNSCLSKRKIFFIIFILILIATFLNSRYLQLL